MSLYDALKALHVLAVAIWVGAAFLQLLLAERVRARAGGDRSAMVADMRFAGARLFPVASGVALLTGIGLVLDGYPDFGDLWVTLAMAGWLISTVTGAVFIEGALKRAEAGDPAGFERAVGLSRLDFVILVLIVIDMVVKPG
jgi:uncharacterized membrane protein